MNDKDKMRLEFEAWAKARDLPAATYHFRETWCYFDLRTAWAHEGYAAGRKVERAEVERLRAELTIREQEVICVRNSQSLELANCKEDNERLRAELAAAKAASVLPVEIQSVYVNKYLGSVVVFIGDEKGAVEFDAWLRDRMKDKTPPQA